MSFSNRYLDMVNELDKVKINGDCFASIDYLINDRIFSVTRQSWDYHLEHSGFEFVDDTVEFDGYRH